MFHTSQSTFNLEVVNYESPQGGITREDKNLLLTCLQLVDKNRHWETIAPILHTWEIQRFMGWLTDILANHEVPSQLTFSEPCIAIQFTEATRLKNRFSFCFLLSYEATPPWWTMPLDNPYQLQVDCNRNDLQEAIDHLAIQLAMFPVR